MVHVSLKEYYHARVVFGPFAVDSIRAAGVRLNVFRIVSGHHNEAPLGS